MLNHAGLSNAQAKALVEGLAYQNTTTDDPSAGNRVFTLTQVQDSGGTANGGVDTSPTATFNVPITEQGTQKCKRFLL